MTKKDIIVLTAAIIIGALIGGFIVDKLRADPAKKEMKEARKKFEKTMDSLFREKEANERAKKINRQNRKDVEKKYKDAADVDYDDNQLDSLLTAFERKSDGR